MDFSYLCMHLIQESVIRKLFNNKKLVLNDQIFRKILTLELKITFIAFQSTHRYGHIHPIIVSRRQSLSMKKLKVNLQRNNVKYAHIPMTNSIKINPSDKQNINAYQQSQPISASKNMSKPLLESHQLSASNAIIQLSKEKIKLNNNTVKSSNSLRKPAVSAQFDSTKQYLSNKNRKSPDKQLVSNKSTKKDLSFSFNPLFEKQPSQHSIFSKYFNTPKSTISDTLTNSKIYSILGNDYQIKNANQSCKPNKPNSSSKNQTIHFMDKKPNRSDSASSISHTLSESKKFLSMFDNTANKFKDNTFYMNGSKFTQKMEAQTFFYKDKKPSHDRKSIYTSTQYKNAPPSNYHSKFTQDQNIKVSIRFRAIQQNQTKTQGQSNSIVRQLNEQVVIADEKVYAFDRLFGNEDQAQIFQQVSRPIIEKVFEGHNGTIFAYGQTGSGKTHTIFGNIYDNNQCGLIPRSIKYIFQNKPSGVIKISCSLVQIYKQEIYDMFFIEQVETKKKTQFKIKQNKQRGVYIQNLTEIIGHNSKDLINVISETLKKRRTSSTKLNQKSSRSHTILSLIADFGKFSSKISLIDLAGSQKVRKSGVTGESLEETKKINYSLSCLGNVINALTTRADNDHIPFRDSKLTRILKDSLSGNFLTSIIVTCNLGNDFYSETISSLKFAERAKRVKILPQNQISLSSQLKNISQSQQSTNRIQNFTQIYQTKIEELSRELLLTKKQLQFYKLKEQIEVRQKSLYDNNNSDFPASKDIGLNSNRTIDSDVGGDLTGRLPIPSQRAFVAQKITKYTQKQIVPLFLGSKRPSLNCSVTSQQQNYHPQFFNYIKRAVIEQQDDLNEKQIIFSENSQPDDSQECYQITESKRNIRRREQSHLEKQSEISFSFSLYREEDQFTDRRVAASKSTRRSIR